MGGAPVAFDRGRGRIHLEEGDETLTVVVARRGAEPARASFPCPRQGLGGHELVISPGERYLAVFLYSGQSEQGYELFELRPVLRACGRLPLVFGEGYGPCFSSDDAWIAMATELDGTFGIDERLDAPEEEHVVDWAELRVQALPDGEIHVCTLRARVAGDLPEPDDVRYPEGLHFPSPTQVALSTTWGERVTLAVPPPEVVVLTGPRA
jgi:hypothetical protein